jgi:hypothetical protein
MTGTCYHTGYWLRWGITNFWPGCLKPWSSWSPPPSS